MSFLPSSDATCFIDEEEGIVILEKNTFVTLEVAPRVQRKRSSTSVPAGFKLVAQELTLPGAVTLPEKSVLPKVASLAALSSTTKDLSDSDAFSDVESTAWSSSSEALRVGDDEISALKPTGAGRAQVKLCELIAPPTVPERRRLSTRAKAFVSGADANARQSGSSKHFRTQVEAIMAAAQSAMLSMGLLASVCTTPTAGSLSVCARVLPGGASYAIRLLDSAKCALVKGVEQSTGIYMLGYQTNPFAGDANGFSATLCCVEDESTACWDYYAKGCCQRGCACKWSHAAFQMTLRVEVRN